MGVISPYKTFTFGGESSADYGVYLTGEGVFNAPERSVEMVEIPGRNGNFALDKGKFENISVTYRVGMFDDDEENFADKVSAFRNWLCSKVGYVRLTDDYNQNEYRMAVYSGGLEVDHDFLIAGEAEITFNCKPQRWLTSGETAVSVADGGTIDNPTLFESEPLLAVKGYGNINFNGYDIDIENAVLGNIVLNVGTNYTTSLPSYPLNGTDRMNVGDTFSINSIKANIGIQVKAGSTKKFKSATLSSVTCSPGTLLASAKVAQVTPTNIDVAIVLNDLALVWETSSTATVNAFVDIVDSDNVSYSKQFQLYFIYTISNPDKISITGTTFNVESWYMRYGSGSISDITAYSTVSALGNPTYIDCDIGECYMYKNGEIVTLNNVIDLGSDLPKLGSGTNTINYDNTVTSLEVTPRWWKV